MKILHLQKKSRFFSIRKIALPSVNITCYNRFFFFFFEVWELGASKWAFSKRALEFHALQLPIPCSMYLFCWVFLSFILLINRKTCYLPCLIMKQSFGKFCWVIQPPSISRRNILCSFFQTASNPGL